MSRTVASDPLLKYKFRVTIPGLPTGMGFQKVNGLSAETEVIEYAEGMFPTPRKLPGKQKVGEVTLERGMYLSTEMEELYKETLDSNDFRKTIIIELLDRFGDVARTWVLAEAWVSKWDGSELDATSNDVAIEKITVQHEYFLN